METRADQADSITLFPVASAGDVIICNGAARQRTVLVVCSQVAVILLPLAA